MAIVICSECGQKVSDKAKICPHCGAPIEATVSNDFGTLHIEWKGQWMATSSQVRVLINGKEVGAYSFQDGFSINVPIPSESTEVSLKFQGFTTQHVFHFKSHQDYNVKVTYNRFAGGFGFEYENENGNVVSDKLSLFMGLVCLLIPIIGFIYALSVRHDKPATCRAALISSALGVFIGLLLMIAIC